ncbi:leucyl aminopeptidase [Fusibacter ferrireducens]|uniref:Probable cytosol aminopeptidase n=1 Tax=Fusibacter ferrireducens TaxID=2785058 RepID=A0ABR9ZQJ4_9FIRM|nr:leucyl aminopeptidase [Fusibacter ferrireducens]MBF4692737.1 leucyl aminopeptidase [Fusibacter ferrireducens]
MKFEIMDKISHIEDSIVLFMDETLAFSSDIPESLSLELSHYVSRLKSKKTYKGKIGEIHYGTIKVAQDYLDVAILGLGNYDTFSVIKLQNSLAEVFRNLKAKNTQSIFVIGEQLTHYMDSKRKRSILLSEVLVMADYEFSEYKSNFEPQAVENIFLLGDFDKNFVDEGIVLGESNKIARHLVNLPANKLTPIYLAELVKSYGNINGFEVTVDHKSEIEALEMSAFLEVAKGSSQPPVLITMRYTGHPESDHRLGFVGKGLTYDSGGLSIKSTSGMVTMKSDMGGAAAVIGAMIAISKLKLKVNVTAVVAACENMISGASYKPGDIISSMAKKSIFIGNTDAEGRLTLIDAVHYIIEKEAVSAVIDVATLTGAAIHCLGHDATCAVSNNDDYYEVVQKSFAKSNEHVWRLPILDEYKELLKHHEADLTNTAGSPGTITAGLFIGEFVHDKPWVHLDIAGTAFKDKQAGIFTKGGTGVATRPLYYVAKKFAAK